jgi:hypothetical protein
MTDQKAGEELDTPTHRPRPDQRRGCVMGWGNCGEDSKGRPIGYVHEATCDHPGCDAKIDRGLSYACGGMHGTEEGGCEGYFCESHLYHVEDPYNSIGRQDGFAVVCESCKHLHNEHLIEDLIEERKTPTAPAITPETLDKVREALETIFHMGISQPEAMNVPDEQWLYRLISIMQRTAKEAEALLPRRDGGV